VLLCYFAASLPYFFQSITHKFSVMKNLDQQFWNQRYAEAQTGWDIGYPSPALKLYVDGLPDKNQTILIPGCGNAYEAGYLLQQGFSRITLIDIAPLVVEKVSLKFETAIEAGTLRIICGDFFELKESYDLILEQTFFCALDPSLRTAYAKQMFQLLNPKGVLAGLWFNFPLTEEGPPFGGSQEEYEYYFKPLFTIKQLSPALNSIKPRAGRELFIELEKT
jgi:SAM-dependent methyltransferase